MADIIGHIAAVVGPLTQAGISQATTRQYVRALLAALPPDELPEAWLAGNCALDGLEKAFAGRPSSLARASAALVSWRSAAQVGSLKEARAAHARHARVVRHLNAAKMGPILAHCRNAAQATAGHSTASHAVAHGALDARRKAPDAARNRANGSPKSGVDHGQPGGKS